MQLSSIFLKQIALISSIYITNTGLLYKFSFWNFWIFEMIYRDNSDNTANIEFLHIKGNDPWGLNQTFVLYYLYFCFCLELSSLVMKRHLTPILYHLDAILAHSLIQNLTFSINQGKIWQFSKNLIFGIIFA